MRPLCAQKMKMMQNHCKFVLAQQPANNFDGKVKYCGLKNQGTVFIQKLRNK